MGPAGKGVKMGCLIGDEISLNELKRGAKANTIHNEGERGRRFERRLPTMAGRQVSYLINTKSVW